MRENNIKKGIAWVTTYSGIEVEEVARAREKLSKVKEATFNVCILGYSSHFYLLGDSTEFIVAQELNLPIKLVQYDENDFIHIGKFDFTSARFPELVDENGNVRVGDFFDRYLWDGDMYEIETADLIIGEPAYTLTPKEQEMKMFAPFESGVKVHKAYVELGMTEDSDLKVYQQYHIQKHREKQN